MSVTLDKNRAWAARPLVFTILLLFAPAQSHAQSVQRVATWSVPPLKKEVPRLDSMHFSPDGKTLAMSVALGDKSQHYFVAYDVATRKETLRFELRDECRTFLYTQDGKTLVTLFTIHRDFKAKEPGAGAYKVIDVRDAKTGKVRHTMRLSGRQAWALHATPDGKTLVCPGAGHVQLIDLATGRGLDRFAAAEHNSRKTALSPDGKLLATLDDKMRLSVYDLRKGKLLSSAELDKDFKAGSSAPCFSPDSKSVTYVDLNGEAFTYDASTGKLLIMKEVKVGRLCAIGYTKGGEALVCAGTTFGAGVCLYSFRQDKRVLAPHNNLAFGPSFGAISPDGTKVAIARGTGGEIRLFEVDPKKDD